MKSLKFYLNVKYSKLYLVYFDFPLLNNNMLILFYKTAQVNAKYVKYLLVVNIK